MKLRKKLTKRRQLSGIILALLLCVSLAVPAVPASAASKKAVLPGVACKSGKYIYYAFEMSGIRMGIMRYDTRTKKKKQITSYRLKGKSTNGFYSLNVKGKYIYAEWDQFYGSGGSKSYIYRINRKTGAKKKLAMGSSPVVIGNYIYYKQVKTADYDTTEETGAICRMTLSGKKKTTVKSGITRTSSGYTFSNLESLYAYGGELLYTTGSNLNVFYTLEGEAISRSSLKIDADYYSDEDTRTVVSGGYKYYTVQTGSFSNAKTTLYRQKLSTGKTSKVAAFRSISNFRVCGNYLMIKATTGSYSKGNYKLNVYCMKVNGKAKKRLARWVPAE